MHRCQFQFQTTDTDCRSKRICFFIGHVTTDLSLSICNGCLYIRNTYKCSVIIDTNALSRCQCFCCCICELCCSIFCKCKRYNILFILCQLVFCCLSLGTFYIIATQYNRTVCLQFFNCLVELIIFGRISRTVHLTVVC